MSPSSPSLTPATLDDIIESYERARESAGVVAAADFLPAGDHPQFREIACELLRVELEYGWRSGTPRALEAYRGDFPAVFADDSLRQQVAFEEYRLRHEHGQQPSLDEYRHKYAVDTSGWSQVTKPAGENGHAHSSSLLSVAPADVSQRFPAVPGAWLEFDLLEELGRGTFARVYLARQGGLSDRLVALKVSTLPTAEPQRLARLQHTNIVPIYSLHEVDGLRAICMPYFGRTTLATLLNDSRRKEQWPQSGREFLSTLVDAQADTVAERSTALGVGATDADRSRAQLPVGSEWSHEWLARTSLAEMATWLVSKVAEGLAHAHQRGIVHRDIKPANLLITDDGRPMILDFNLSADAALAAQPVEALGGTLPYMPPEQIAALRDRSPAQSTDPRSDVYSLGVVFFELLTGRLPFPTRRGSLNDIADSMIADRHAPLPNVQADGANLSPDVESIVRKCLAADPAARYAHAGELHDDLRRHLEHLPLVHAANRSWRERARKWRLRHPRLASGTTVGVLAGGVLVAMAAGWTQLRHDYARQSAASAFAAFRAQAPATITPLSTHDLDAQSLADAQAAARSQLAAYGVGESKSWRDGDPFRLLPADDRVTLSRELGQLAYLLASQELRQAQLHSAGERRQQHLAAALEANTLAETCHESDAVPRAAWRQRAEIYELLGDAVAAKSAREQAVSANRDAAEDRYLAAVEHLQQGRPRESAKLLSDVCREQPANFAAHYALGHAQLASGDVVAAEARFTQCVTLAPRSHLSYFYRGIARLERRQFVAAEDDFEEVLRLRPKLATAYVNCALAHQGQREWQAAIDDLTAALECGSSETRLYFLRARIREQLGDQSGAEADRRTGMSQSPADEKSWIARGVAQVVAAPEQALADFRTALEKYPRSRDAWENIAHVQAERLKQPAEAVRTLDQLLAVFPDDAKALVGRGVVQARLEKYDAALADAKRAVALRRDAETTYGAACAFALAARADGDHAKPALALLSEALLLDPRRAKLAHQDDDLAPLRTHPQFRTLLAAAQLLAKTRAAWEGDGALNAK